MKLTKISQSEISQSKEMPGLLSCRLQYEIKSAKGALSYTGPKFSPEMWHQVMSFFRWTNKEMHSESQVRLYVNSKLGRWGAWAFPQEARTGMSAREIVVQETPAQASERFALWQSQPSGDWLYFCTVHHHCSAGAFQSGTDENNERGQDGLHITVGRMDADQQRQIHLVETAFTTRQKTVLLMQLREEKREGVVFKRLDAPYTPGRPNSGGTQLKHKFYATLSAVVAKINAQRSVEIRLLNADGWVTAGNVTIPPNHKVPKVGAVVDLRYLYAHKESGCLYQPTYLGPRTDIEQHECGVSQLKFKPTEEDEL